RGRTDGAGAGPQAADAPDADAVAAAAHEYRPPRRHARSLSRALRRLQDGLHSPTAVTVLILGVALVWLVYELRVGGDFMHGRVLLPVVFLLTAPLAMIPVPLRVLRRGAPRRAAPAAVARTAVPVLGWIGVIAWAL